MDGSVLEMWRTCNMCVQMYMTYFKTEKHEKLQQELLNN